MKTLLFVLAALCFKAHAQDMSVIYDRMMSTEQRRGIQELLQQGQDKPLPVTAAIAELCFDVDICASLDLSTPTPSYCDLSEEPEFGDQCFPFYMREKYSCSASVDKQSVRELTRMSNLFSEYEGLYTSYSLESLFDRLTKRYGVDFRQLARNPKRAEEFLKKHPEIARELEFNQRENLTLAAYTGNCYGNMSRILGSKDERKLLRYFNLFAGLSNVMGSFPEYKGMVNRGANMSGERLKEYHTVGSIVCNAGYTSTAKHDPETDYGSQPRNSFLSGKCTQRMYITYDSRAVGGKDISSASVHKSENEVLFEPGACFRVDKVYPRTDEVILEDGEEDRECGEGEHYNFELTLIR